jgi:molybdate transport repressor ModE-like protein
MSVRTTKQQILAAVRPRAKLWIEADGESVLCDGLRRILRAVEQTGSIKHAAVEVGRSYRFVWARIKEAEDALGGELVASQVGGGSSQRSELTLLGSELLDEFDQLQAEVFRLVDKKFQQRLKRLVDRHGA